MKLPYLALRNQVVFPGEKVYGIFVGGKERLAAVASAEMNPPIRLFVSLETDKGVHPVGVLIQVGQVLKLPDGNVKLMDCVGLQKGIIQSIENPSNHPMAEVSLVDDSVPEAVTRLFEERALELITTLEKRAKEPNGRFLSASECKNILTKIDSPLERASFIQTNILLFALQKSPTDLQQILELETEQRYDTVLNLLQTHIRAMGWDWVTDTKVVQ